ncbi:MAG: MGMT family protein [Candidatus Micrarchaeia archaeon]
MAKKRNKNKENRNNDDGIIFKERVYSILRKIPKGKVITYKRLAELAGNNKAARVVGNLMRRNKNPEKIPCYKVVKSNGGIGGYSAKGGVKKKIQLLKKDGIKIKNGKIEKRFFY